MISQALILDIVEMALLACGTALVAAGIIALSLRNAWSGVLRLPDPPEHGIEPTDLLVGVAAVLFLNGAFLAVLQLPGLGMHSQQPASSPAVEDLPATAGAVANTASQFTAALILLLLGKARFAGGLAGWGLHTAHLFRQAVRAVVAYVAVWPVCAGVLIVTVAAIQLVDPAYSPREHNAIRTLLKEGLPLWQYGLTAANALLLAPIVEELLFRGLVQPAFAKWFRSPWKAVLFTGWAFGMFHFGVGYTVPAMTIFGVTLGYCYAKTRSLTLVILLHMVFNGKTLLWLALSRQ